MKRILNVEVPAECAGCSDDSVRSCWFKIIVAEKQTQMNTQCFVAMGILATKMLEAKVQKE